MYAHFIYSLSIKNSFNKIIIRIIKVNIFLIFLKNKVKEKMIVKRKKKTYALVYYNKKKKFKKKLLNSKKKQNNHFEFN